MVTEATEDGYRPIKGADHKKSTWHYRLTPGTAYLAHPGGSTEEVTITEEQARQARPTYYIRFIGGRSVVEFQLGKDLYCQPLPVRTDPSAHAKSKRAGPIARKGQVSDPVSTKKRREAPRRKITYEPL